MLRPVAGGERIVRSDAVPRVPVSRTPLLFWSSLCFVGLTVNNLLLFIDLVLLPTTVDLATLRGVVALASVCLLLYGLIWEVR